MRVRIDQSEHLIAKLPGNVDLQKNAKVRLMAAPEKMHLFDAQEQSFLYR